MAHEKEKALVQAMTPLIEEIVGAKKRINALEQNATRTAGDAACDALVKMCDGFLRGEPIAVSELPHIEQRIMVLRAYGKRIEDVLPEVTA